MKLKIPVVHKDGKSLSVSAFTPHTSVCCQLYYIIPKTEKSESETEVRKTFNERHLLTEDDT